MAIQHDDGTFGPTEPASEVAEKLRKHFAGVERLEKEPSTALFGATEREVEAKKKQANLNDLQRRIEALEKERAIEGRGLVVIPTPEEVQRLAAREEGGE